MNREALAAIAELLGAPADLRGGRGGDEESAKRRNAFLLRSPPK
jgi:hypothetical protein